MRTLLWRAREFLSLEQVRQLRGKFAPRKGQIEASLASGAERLQIDVRCESDYAGVGGGGANLLDRLKGGKNSVGQVGEDQVGLQLGASESGSVERRRIPDGGADCGCDRVDLGAKEQVAN